MSSPSSTRRKASSLTTTTTTKMILLASLLTVALLPLMVSCRATTTSNEAESTTSTTSNKLFTDPSEIKLGLINGGSDFFVPIEEGFLHQCKVMGIGECFTGYGTTILHPVTNETCNSNCARDYYLNDFLEKGVHGIMMKPYNGANGHNYSREVFSELFEERDQFPIVTFDSDIVNSSRIAYVGTDQVFLGQTMARLLRQLRPEGGTYAMIAQKSGRIEGFVTEISKYNDDMDTDQGHWYEVEKEGGWEVAMPEPGDKVDYLDRMEQYMTLNENPPDAFIFFRQTPMKHENYTAFVDKYRHLNVTYIGTDGSDFQLAYLNRNYVDGLVGQLPYEIGTRSVKLMYDILMKPEYKQSLLSKLDENGTIDTNNNQFPTNVVAFNVIPIELPKLDVEKNLIGELHSIGYVCFGITAVVIMICVTWTIYYRQNVIVKAAQPFFLLMVCCGVLIMASSLIPLSFDDNGITDPKNQIWDGVYDINTTYGDPIDVSLVLGDDNEGGDDAEDSIYLDTTYRIGICMSIPWLAFIGFTITFSALFSKTWRVNKLFNVASRRASAGGSGAFQHVQVSEYDVLVPFTILMSCNVIVLLAWTLLDPLIYTREEYEGTDYWNRVIATYGFCRARNEFDSGGGGGTSSVLYYLVPLMLLNTCVLFLACYQAFQARDIQSEFAESKYIGLTLSSILQTFLTGIPIVFVVRDMPEAFYVVTTFMIFILCMVVLLFIFIPKIYKQYTFNKLTEREQRSVIQRSIHHTTKKLNSSASGRNLGNSSSFVANNSTPSGALSDDQRHFDDKNKSTDCSQNYNSQTSQSERKNNNSSVAFSIEGIGGGESSNRSLGVPTDKGCGGDAPALLTAAVSLVIPPSAPVKNERQQVDDSTTTNVPPQEQWKDRSSIKDDDSRAVSVKKAEDIKSKEKLVMSCVDDGQVHAD